jgi:Mlc titration factor MtfA (ptsG expression regulator)
MKIKPAQLVGLPFAIAAFVGFYLAYTKSSDYALYAAVPLILLSVTFVLSPQINWWWYKRNPPDTTAGITRFLENVPYYRLLSPDLKPQFRKRVALYMQGNQFMRPAPREEDNRTRSDVPEDLKAAAAASAVQLTFGLKDFMLDKFENIVIYPQAFPSPQYPDRLHLSEVYEEDGVIIFSADALIQGLTNQNLFNVGLYEYAKAYQIQYLKTKPIQWETTIWEKLAVIGGMNEADFQRFLNLPDIDIFGVAVHHFFKLPAAFQKVLPDLYQLFEKMFKQNPLNSTTPIDANT